MIFIVAGAPPKPRDRVEQKRVGEYRGLNEERPARKREDDTDDEKQSEARRPPRRPREHSTMSPKTILFLFV
tara:strand:- start:307 stop:522 length:216 start_codon:yes stop_codon:yes gene_type:complete